MENSFTTFGNLRRLAIVEHLLLQGPSTQEKLRSELSIPNARMTELMATLIDSGLVVKDSARGLCRLEFEDQIREILILASELDSSIAEARAERAAKTSSALKKSRLRVAPNRRASGGT